MAEQLILFQPAQRPTQCASHLHELVTEWRTCSDRGEVVETRCVVCRTVVGVEELVSSRQTRALRHDAIRIRHQAA